MPRDLTVQPLLLRVSEAAHMLAISRSQAYELVASGYLPSIKIGTSIRISKADLEQWIEEQKNSVYATKQAPTTRRGEGQRRGS